MPKPGSSRLHLSICRVKLMFVMLIRGTYTHKELQSVDGEKERSIRKTLARHTFRSSFLWEKFDVSLIFYVNLRMGTMPMVAEATSIVSLVVSRCLMMSRAKKRGISYNDVMNAIVAIIGDYEQPHRSTTMPGNREKTIWYSLSKWSIVISESFRGAQQGPVLFGGSAKLIMCVFG